MPYLEFSVFIILLELSVASPALLDYADRANVVENKSTPQILVNLSASIPEEKGGLPIFGHQNARQVIKRQAVIQEDRGNID